VTSRETLAAAPSLSRSRSFSHRGGAVAPLVGLALGVGTLLSAGSAQALPLLTLWGSVRGLYGSALGDAELNAYGPGVGLRAGVTLPASLYLGASFDYFTGESESAAGVDISASVLQLLGNVGYDAGLGPLTLRPNLGFGLAQTRAELEDESTSEGNFAVSPGAEVFLGLGLLTVSGELRYNHVFVDGDADAIIVGVGLGLTL
jgi:hypothetical protein